MEIKLADMISFLVGKPEHYEMTLQATKLTKDGEDMMNAIFLSKKAVRHLVVQYDDGTIQEYPERI